MGFRTNLLKFDKNNCPESFTFVLANKSLTHLGQLHNVEDTSVHYVGNLNGADEISLKVYKTINGEVEPLWDDIVDFKTLYVVEIGEYFEIKISLDDEKNGYKTLTCTSLCEAELSNLNLYDMEVNTENEADIINTNISVEEYEVTVFYNEENPDKSLLHRVLKDKAPHYTIKYVDDSLKNEIRSFSINGSSIYEFLTGECAEQFNCMFVFNSPDRSISVYDLYTVCNGCGHRGIFNDVCPECGSDFLNYFGNDTTIYIDKENFAENIKFEVDTDSVKNCFRLVAGDEDMTATVRSLNQNGSNYIYHITEDTKKDMSSELVKKLDNYDELYDNYTDEYQHLLGDYYKAVDDVLYYESSMMPEKPSDDEDTDNEISIANQEISKLTSEKMLSVGVVDITTSTPITTINNAVENYAKVFVNTSLVKVKITEGTFVYKGKEDNTDFDYGIWTGTIQLTSYSDEEDIATTALALTVHDNYADFAQQKVMKEIARDDSDHSIYDVISIEDLDEFKEALTYYSLSRLKSFETAIETALDTLIGINQGSKDAETYDVFYSPYCDKRDACITEREKRELTIAEIRDQINDITKRMSEIQEILDFKSYLGLELYKEFSSYRREQEYSNSNYISDGLNDTERIIRAKQFIESAKNELYKSATKQGHISTDLYNLLAMEEFKSLVESFALGNFIRVKVDGTIYRLRLIKFEINFSDLTKLPVEFSDMTVSANGLNDIKSILNSAQNISRTYSYTAKQAEKGEVANSTFEQMYQDGLNSALFRIKNNNQEEIITDKHGLTCRAWDDIENDYSPEQLRLTHNILCFTDNNWRSTTLGLGKHNYYKFDNDGVCRQYTGYGLSAQFLTAPYINNAQFIGGDIYSTNYSPNGIGSYLNLNNGDFSLAGGKIKYDSESNDMTLKGVTIAWDTTNSPEITDISGLNEYLTQLDGRIQTYSQDTDPSTSWTNEEKKNNVGDLWFDTKNELTKRWNGSSWDTVTDSELQKLAQSKAQIFTTTPTVPYYKGDLWVQGASGDILNCVTTRTSGIYTASDWEKSSKYTDDEVANSALEAAKQGIEDAASALTRAENAETNAKTYADTQDASLSETLTKAYETYTKSEISAFDKQVANYLGLGGGTIIGENYMISPIIGGGYLNITNTNNNSRVIIDPNNLTGNNYIFQVHNGTEVSVGIDKDGNAIFNGTVYATDGKFSGTVEADEGYFGDCSIVDGKLTIPAANITGTLSGTHIDGSTLNITKGAKIGGWDIGDGYISSGDWSKFNDGDVVFMSTGTKSSYTISNVNTNGWVFGAGTTFGVTKGGALYCTSGKIGGNYINTEGLFFNNGDTGYGLWGTTNHANIAIHAGTNTGNISGAPFKVYHNGRMEATIGNIGGWEIQTNYLEGKPSSDYTVKLYANGVSYNGKPFFLVVYRGDTAVAGLSVGGWSSITP